MSAVISILLVVAIFAYLGYNIFALVRDHKNVKKVRDQTLLNEKNNNKEV